MKVIKCLTLLSVWLVMMCSCHRVGVREAGELPDYPVPGGVSAPFAGVVGDYMIVGGGCNFPDVPAADGGAKRFYDNAYCRSMTGDGGEWQPIVDLPLALAYGASVVTDDGIVCVGGMCADSAVTQAFLIRQKPDCDDAPMFEICGLPPLPVAVDNGAAAFADGIVYVAGGNQADGGNRLYALAPGDTAWHCLPACPGPKRVQPVLLAADGQLYLAGGFCYDRLSNTCTIPADMVPYNIATRQWGEPVSFPAKPDGTRYALVGGSGVTVGNRLLLTGGVDYRIFQDAMEGKAPADYLKKPAEWYRFNSDVLVYDTARARWEVCRDVGGMNRAGGVLLLADDHLFMICGEVKPGIRSTRIGAYELSGFGGDTKAASVVRGENTGR